MAPFLVALAKAGLPLLASAVASKGKEIVEKELGVDVESLLGSEEGKLRLKELEFKHEEFLQGVSIRKAELELEDKKLDHANTASAREMNSAVQSSANASTLAKEAAYYLDFLIVIATIGLAYTIFLSDTALVNQELAYTAFGSLLTMCGTILNFHRGTSRGSAEKDYTIKSLTGVTK